MTGKQIEKTVNAKRYSGTLKLWGKNYVGRPLCLFTFSRFIFIMSAIRETEHVA